LLGCPLPSPSGPSGPLGRHGPLLKIMLFKKAVIVEGKCALLVGKDQSSLNKLQSDEEEIFLSSLESFSALRQTGLTLAVSAFSTTTADPGMH